MQTAVGKKKRAQDEAKARNLRSPVTKIYVSIAMCIPDSIFLKWIETTTSFPQMLRAVAYEYFGEREVVSLWEQGLCQIISDLAVLEMTPKERKDREIDLPRDILFWFADFLERTFSKPLMRWDSPLFSKQAVEPLTAFLVHKSQEQQTV